MTTASQEPSQTTKTTNEKRSFKFKPYDPKTETKPLPLKFYSTSVDFLPQIDNPYASLFPTTSLSNLTKSERKLSSSLETNSLEQVLGSFEKGPFADEILAFLDPFVKSLHEKDLEINSVDGSVIESVIENLRNYCENHKKETRDLIKLMNVKQLIVPYISLNLPGDVILSYNELEEDDPQVLLYQNHPAIAKEVRELGVFLDRYDTNKEVLCLLVWSNVDNVLVNLPSVRLNPYPLCWNCTKSFGMHVCGRCSAAKYCSRSCQVQQWKDGHRDVCPEMAYYSSKHKRLCIS
eukprot:TRINITY_DN10714_c0_g1_i1.p1 TRINITY_DN10714_c0_g1~~TRINITY_DN10714_c0_g1_i1.p1  ORF type:complete len:292 (+),score=42.62 TRINITY_DN10714_c0_g1_i1:151-1026(+)